MNRKEKTKFLSDLLVSEKLNQRGIYWASEVTLNMGTSNMKRVDFMKFTPRNQSVSGIEQGLFTCYEVKSCKEDFNSGNGVNFIGDKNYIVTDMETYKKIVNELQWNVGVIVPVPFNKDKLEEFENPTSLENKVKWEMRVIRNAMLKDRNYPMNELLFCMLRSGK